MDKKHGDKRKSKDEDPYTFASSSQELDTSNLKSTSKTYSRHNSGRSYNYVPASQADKERRRVMDLIETEPEGDSDSSDEILHPPKRLTSTLKSNLSVPSPVKNGPTYLQAKSRSITATSSSGSLERWTRVMGDNTCTSSSKPTCAKELNYNKTDQDVRLTFQASKKLSPPLSPIRSQSSYCGETIKITVNGHTYEIDAKAISTLNPRKMLNDTIVEFYSNYLLDNSQAKSKFHLYNTFFYSSLTKGTVRSLRSSQSSSDGQKDPVIDNCKIAAERWDKNVKIFDKDYLVIPICKLEHWVLVIVCFASEASLAKALPVRNDKQRPLIILFDSLKHSSNISRITTPIRIFLNHRWNHERKNEQSIDFTDITVMKEICAKIPRQRNPFDCGIHLLRALEGFLSEPITLYSHIEKEGDITNNLVVNTEKERRKIKYLIYSHLAKTKADDSDVK